MNEHDSERLAGLLVAEGMEPAERLDDADVLVFNTCCIRENADNRLYGELGRLKELADRKPGLRIAVGGCLAQKDREKIRERAPHVDVVFGTHNLTSAPALLSRSLHEGPITEVLDAPDPDAPPPHLGAAPLRELPYAAWITIQTGCDNSCAFCIVPSVRGGEVSRPPDEVVAEVEELARRGVVEITLLGQNVNSYGRDLTKRSPLFADLLRKVGSVEGIDRVRFTSPHPKDLRPETMAAMAETAAVCEQLHLPLQSGSNRVLAAMRRGYTAERYLARLAAVRAAVPDLAVSTDIIVGFPGETDDDFEATLDLVREVGFVSVFGFKFSPRPHTPALKLADDVPEEEKSSRLQRLFALSEALGGAHLASLVGTRQEVLIEGPSRTANGAPRVTGRTKRSEIVHVDAGEGGDVTGTVAVVEITRAFKHSLEGRWTDVPQRRAPPVASRRRALPIAAT